MKLRVYKSFDDAADAEAKDAALKAPLDGIRETVALILRVYGVTTEELNNRKKDRRIHIIKTR